MTNRIDLSQPFIDCQIECQSVLPSEAYPIIGKLAAALETANAELEELYEGGADPDE